MLELGKIQTLVADRRTSVGLYLRDTTEDDEDVLLPQQYVTPEMRVGDEIEVFLYRDNEERLVSTTQIPLVQLNQFALLECKDVSTIGAFMDWGLLKQLLVPYKNQANRMERGKHYMVYMYEDDLTQRLVGSTKLEGILNSYHGDDLAEGDQVSFQVYGNTDIGVKGIINDTYKGLIYNSDLYEPLKLGQKIAAYIVKIRGDGKLDLRLEQQGYAGIDEAAKYILHKLTQTEGFLPYHDKSDPDAIRSEFKMSKKAFKKALGSLYKNKVIEIKSDGIYAVKKEG